MFESNHLIFLCYFTINLSCFFFCSRCTVELWIFITKRAEILEGKIISEFKSLDVRIEKYMYLVKTEFDDQSIFLASNLPDKFSLKSCLCRKMILRSTYCFVINYKSFSPVHVWVRKCFTIETDFQYFLVSVFVRSFFFVNFSRQEFISSFMNFQSLVRLFKILS